MYCIIDKGYVLFKFKYFGDVLFVFLWLMVLQWGVIDCGLVEVLVGVGIEISSVVLEVEVDFLDLFIDLLCVVQCVGIVWLDVDVFEVKMFLVGC